MPVAVLRKNDNPRGFPRNGCGPIRQTDSRAHYSKLAFGAVAGLATLVTSVALAAEGEGASAVASSRVGQENRRSDTALRYDLPIDLGVTLGAAALAGSLELLSPVIAPARCRWCDRDASGRDTLNGFDASIRNALRWSDPSYANRVSNVFTYGVAPLTAAGVWTVIAWNDHRMDELPLDWLCVAQAAVIAADVDELSKLAFARERPDIHARTPAERTAHQSSDDNMSFFSGHTTLAFALAASTGTVASMRKYRLAPLLWATGMTLAAVSGYLRVAADRHYATDVIAGAVVGSAIGFGVPYFAHHPGGPDVHLTALPTSGGTALLLTGAW